MMLELTEMNFAEEINTELVIVDFYATWCGPCKAMIPVLEQIADQVKVCKVNADEQMGLATQYNIAHLPTLVFFKDGQMAANLVGLQTKKALEQKIQELKTN